MKIFIYHLLERIFSVVVLFCCLVLVRVNYWILTCSYDVEMIDIVNIILRGDAWKSECCGKSEKEGEMRN